MNPNSFKENFIDTGLIKDIKAWCFGKDPIVSPIQVAFSAGAKMFSSCAVFSFICPKIKEHNVFKIVFCAKLHSKIFRKDPTNRSCWYIWQPIGSSGCLVLDIDKFEKMTGIDVYKFTRTDFFKKAQKIFKQLIDKGISKAIELRAEVKHEDENEYETYIQSLKEASEIVTQLPEFNDKSYKLINYDKFREELKKKGFEKELKMRGDAMTKSNTKIGRGFMNRVLGNAPKDEERAKAKREQLKKFADLYNSQSGEE